MSSTENYAIGTPGKKWDAQDKSLWLSQQKVQRSYLDDVVSKINAFKSQFNVQQYGALSYDETKYPLFVIKSVNWSDTKPTVLVTGGVHGYETSGVLGALEFLNSQAHSYSEQFNIVVVPCVSPWGYETINRWNPNAVDPNRSFYQDSPAEESAGLMSVVSALNLPLMAHIDLHETTDTDNSEFRPALAARDAVEHTNWNIPDGFYLVGDTIKPVVEFQAAIIKAVEKVTHIAPADENNNIIGAPLQQWGVINYATKALSLCIGFSDATYATTTEVYPDSSTATPQECIQAQVASITGAFDHLITQL